VILRRSVLLSSPLSCTVIVSNEKGWSQDTVRSSFEKVCCVAPFEKNDERSLLIEITFPPLYLWHGELDKDVPVAMGRAVAGRLAYCKATYYPDEGHLSLIVNHREEIVTTLMSEASRSIHFKEDDVRVKRSRFSSVILSAAKDLGPARSFAALRMTKRDDLLFEMDWASRFSLMSDGQ
jgi:hypothetical protein